MKKELNIPKTWQYQVKEAVISSIDMSFAVDMLSLMPIDNCSHEINIVLLPNNGLSFTVKQDESWQNYENLDELAKHYSNPKIIQDVYFGLFKLWQCLTPSKARKMILRNKLYQETIGDAAKDKTSSIYFDRLAYVTGHLYRFIKSLLQKKSPNWSVIATPIIYNYTPPTHQQTLNDAEA